MSMASVNQMLVGKNCTQKNQIWTLPSGWHNESHYYQALMENGGSHESSRKELSNEPSQVCVLENFRVTLHCLELEWLWESYPSINQEELLLDIYIWRKVGVLIFIICILYPFMADLCLQIWSRYLQIFGGIQNIQNWTKLLAIFRGKRDNKGERRILSCSCCVSNCLTGNDITWSRRRPYPYATHQ